MSITPFFSGEIQLAGWSESHNSGSKISFWLPETKDLDPFRTATIRKGNKAGQRFACVLVEIGDDEQIIQPFNGVRKTDDLPPQNDEKADNSAALVARAKGGELAKWAGILSNDPVFWEWANETDECLPLYNQADAAAYIRDACNVTSRAELDHSPEAAKIFRNMMGEFDDWKNGGRAA